MTGNQWFEPVVSNPGTLLRSLWHAGSLVPTAIYNNPWAGTFAMRMEDVRRARLAKIWRKSIVDDGPIRRALQPLGLTIYFNPSLVMINREKCTLAYVVRYVSRTLTWSKMYEPTFINTVFHCVATVGLMFATLLMLVVAAVTAHVTAVAVLAAGFLTASLFNALSYSVVRNAVSISSSNLGSSLLPRMGLFKSLKLMALTPIAYLIYGCACFQASLRQKIQWRQITYELRGKSKVKMVRYRPWVAEETEQVHSEVSI